MWATLEQYTQGERDDSHKFDDSVHFHQVYDLFADALETFDRLQQSGKAFAQHRKELCDIFMAPLRNSNRLQALGRSNVIFYVMPGEEAALVKMRDSTEQTVAAKARQKRQRHAVIVADDEF